MADARIAFAAGIGLCVGLLGGAMLLRDHPPTPTVDADGTAGEAWRGELSALREQVAAERDARRSLAAEVALLHQALEGFPASESGEWEGDAAGSGPEATTADTSAEPSAEAGGGTWFDEESLIEAGLTAPDAARLREQFEAQELAELYLRDHAAREGWVGRPRFGRELRAGRDAFREAVGDDDLDRILWAAGRNNRVSVASVLQNSPAAGAQIQPGDHVVSYAGRRIFGMRELTELTRQGTAGEPTVVVLEKNGVERTEIVPRGPLGLRLQPARSAPDMLR